MLPPVSAGPLDDSSMTTWTQPRTVIVGLKPYANVNFILWILQGLVLDASPDARVYLISLPRIPIWLPPGVDYIEANWKVPLPASIEAGIVEAGPNTLPQWYLAQPSLQIVHATEAQSYSDGAGAVIADIDARFDETHPALAGHLQGGHDFVADREPDGAGLDQSGAAFMFDDEQSFLGQSSNVYLFDTDHGFLDQSGASHMFQEAGASVLPDSVVKLLSPADAAYSHGTFTAGLIAAMAPRSPIIPIRAFDDQGESDVFTLAKSIRYAVNAGADVINMSWGMDVDSTTLRNAIQFAAAHNVILVASAGNSATNERFYPAAYPGVAAVAATNELDRKASFSTFGPQIYVDAPGVNIISAYPGGLYAVKSGTSFSAPIVAAEAALIRSLHRDDGVGRVGNTAVNIDAGNPGYAGQLGLGRVDVLEGVTSP
jgi:subtilisin family serine protease